MSTGRTYSPDPPEVRTCRAKSVQIPSGDSFGFPFESPALGCVVRFAFQVHDGGEAAFEFKHGGVLLHEAHGEAGEVMRTRTACASSLSEFPAHAVPCPLTGHTRAPALPGIVG